MKILWVLGFTLGCASALPPGGSIGGLALGDATAVEDSTDTAIADAGVWARDPRCGVGYCACCGRCQFADAGMCVALTNADCKQAGGCTGKDSYGACMTKAGACVEGPDSAACAGASSCTTVAKCAFIDGHCAPGSKADCEASNICKQGGRCTFAQGECIPQTDADCAGSNLCKQIGACHFVKGYETVSEGKAVYLGGCHPNGTADCQQSTKCLNGGYCVYSAKHGKCELP
jgi:hypothetical protein